MATKPLTMLAYATCATLLCGALPAQAVDPEIEVNPLTSAAPARSYRTLPESIVPKRYYAAPAPLARAEPASPEPVVVANAPTPLAVAEPVSPEPVVVANATAPQPARAIDPEIAATPTAPLPEDIVPKRYYAPTAPLAMAETTPASPTITMAQATQPETAAVQTAAASPVPERSEPIQAPASANTSTYDADRFSVGVEAVYDHYEEPDEFPDLNNRIYYGSLNFGYEHYFNPTIYANVEQRVSHGHERYKSSQGYIADIPQWEFETRLTGGYDRPIGENGRLKTYFGLGTRYYIDQSKGKVTSGGSSAYERRIFQLYAPIGVTYEFPAYGLTFAPNVEIDPLLYGSVQSRLQNITGGEEFNNRQTAGYGLRAEFMVGQQDVGGFGWQFGPFVRYWDIEDSKLDSNFTGDATEPHNTRLQAGAKLKFLF